MIIRWCIRHQVKVHICIRKDAGVAKPRLTGLAGDSVSELRKLHVMSVQYCTVVYSGTLKTIILNSVNYGVRCVFYAASLLFKSQTDTGIPPRGGVQFIRATYKRGNSAHGDSSQAVRSWRMSYRRANPYQMEAWCLISSVVPTLCFVRRSPNKLADAIYHTTTHYNRKSAGLGSRHRRALQYARDCSL